MNIRVLLFFLSLHVMPFVCASQENLSLITSNGVRNMQKEYATKSSVLTGNDVSAKLERKYYKYKGNQLNIDEELKEEPIVVEHIMMEHPADSMRHGCLTGITGCAVTGMPIMAIVVSHTTMPIWTIFMPLAIGAMLGCCVGATSTDEKFLNCK